MGAVDMQKWEYMMFKLPGIKRDPTGLDTKEDDGAILRWLQELGADGWEVVYLRFEPFSYSTDPKMTVKYAMNVKGYFKRPVKEPMKEVICDLCEKDIEMHEIVFMKKTPSCVPERGYLTFGKDGYVNYKCVFNKEG
jgi:hypothetical protein